MKRQFPLLFLLIFILNSVAYAAFFKWVDDHGVVHFTDNRNKIPKKYRKQAKQLAIMDDSSPSKPPQQAAPAAAQPPASQELTYGGHDQYWWRQQFASQKARVQTLQESLVQKNTKLTELRRKRAIYFRAQDRVAINNLQDLITAEESKLSDALKQLDELDQEATRAGVPADWRQ
ncbi:MAG TPA: DUF4124 domain-containing protein [Geomonas sp.]|nr:DUF4124 domain-containing protein [Geomonas sp.]